VKMVSLLIPPLLILTGCHPRLRVGSPQFQRSPQITCIVIVESDSKVSVELAQATLNACKDAIEQKEPKQP